MLTNQQLSDVIDLGKYDEHRFYIDKDLAIIPTDDPKLNNIVQVKSEEFKQIYSSLSYAQKSNVKCVRPKSAHE